MTDAEAVAAAHWALVHSGAGNVALARFGSSVEVGWRRRDHLGDHAELVWHPARDQVGHVLVTGASGLPQAYLVTS